MKNESWRPAAGATPVSSTSSRTTGAGGGSRRAAAALVARQVRHRGVGDGAGIPGAGRIDVGIAVRTHQGVYLDMLAAYSALNFGHQHPDLVKAAKDQMERLTLTSRAFHNDQFGPFCSELTQLAG